MRRGIKQGGGILALCCAVTFGQQGAAQKWEPQSTCGVCSEVWQNGVLYRGIDINGIGVRVALRQSGQSVYAEADVTNRTKLSVNVFPSMFTLRAFDRDQKRRDFAALTIDELFPGPSKWDRITAAAAGGAAGAAAARPQKTGSATVHNPDGSTSRVDIYENGTPPPTPPVDVTPRQQTLAGMLRENTIEPRMGIKGRIYFGRIDTKRRLTTLTIAVNIGGNSYEIPFDLTQGAGK